MNSFRKTWMCALMVAVFPTLGLAQTSDDISESLDFAERAVAEAEQALVEMAVDIDQAAKNADQLERAVNFGRNIGQLAIRVQQAIQNADRLSGVMTDFRRSTGELRIVVEDIERRAENVDSKTKARVEKLVECMKQLDSDTNDTETTLRKVTFKLHELRAKIQNTGGFGTGS